MKNFVLKDLAKFIVFVSLLSPLFLGSRAEAGGWGSWNVVRAGNQIWRGNYGRAEQFLNNRTCFGSCWGGWAAKADNALDNGHPGWASYDIRHAEQYYWSTH